MLRRVHESNPSHPDIVTASEIVTDMAAATDFARLPLESVLLPGQVLLGGPPLAPRLQGCVGHFGGEARCRGGWFEVRVDHSGEVVCATRDNLFEVV